MKYEEVPKFQKGWWPLFRNYPPALFSSVRFQVEGIDIDIDF